MGQSWLADPNADGDEAHDRKRPEQLCRYLTRFHGVLAPNAKLRSLVVPQGPPKDEQAPGVANGLRLPTP